MSSPAVLPVAQPIKGIRGAYRVFRTTVTDVDTGARKDITGATVEFQVRTAAGVADPPLISKAVGAGITILDQANAATKGQADIVLAAADTSALAAGTYSYDLVIIVGGERRVLVPPSPFVLKEAGNQA